LEGPGKGRGGFGKAPLPLKQGEKKRGGHPRIAVRLRKMYTKDISKEKEKERFSIREREMRRPR